MGPRPQSIAIKRVLVETLPLLKRHLGPGLVLLGIPHQHLGLPLDTRALAVRLDHARRVIEEIVGIDNADLYALRVPIHFAIGFGFSSKLGADLAYAAQVVEQNAELFVSSLVGTEVVETGHLVERGDRAAVVARDAVLGMADQECEVVGCEKVCGDHGRIPRLCFGVIRVWWSS